MAIKITYRACDGYRKTRYFKTLAAARMYAQHQIGEHPEMGGTYAVSGDGIGTIRVQGATLREIFPPPAPKDTAAKDRLASELETFPDDYCPY